MPSSRGSFQPRDQTRAGDWYTARGVGESLGAVGKPENAALLIKLRQAFAGWIDNGHTDFQDENTVILDNGHTDFQDENTVILRIRVTQAVLMSHGVRYEL